MNERLGIILAFLVAAGGLVALQGGSARSSGPRTEADAAAQSRQAAAAACGLEAPCLVDKHAADDGSAVATTWINDCRGRMQFLVALVPDPVDAHTGWLFDPMIEALQRAAEANHYTLDRFALPWDQGAVAKAACGANAEASRECGTASPQESLPGVLLLRNTHGSGELTIFLVGETPTAGIHKRALYAALDRIAECGQTPVRILGPTFSGSTRSLSIALSGWWDRKKDWRRACIAVPPPGPPLFLPLEIEAPASRMPAEPSFFRIISGTATAVDRDELARIGETEHGAPLAEFAATVLPDTFVLSYFISDYLRRMGVDSDHIGLLVEGNTDYGRSILNSEAVRGRKILTLPFPMHLSGARSAIERVREKAPHDEAIPGGPRPDLGVALVDEREPRDIVPQMYPKVTGPSAEFVLANILATISRNDITHVGLLASDMRDKLFLAEQVNKYCPGVRLFTLESDLQYAHPNNRRDLAGMLVASTYPLFNRTQAWTLGGWSAPRLQFPNSAAQGVYNAALVLLGFGAEWLMPDYAWPSTYSEPMRGDEGGEDLDRIQQPVLWISAVGNGGLWPLEVATMPPDGRAYVWTNPVRIKRADQIKELEIGSARTTVLVWALITIFSLIWSVRCLASNRLRRDGNGSWGTLARWLTSELLVARHEHRAEQLRYVAVSLLALTTLYVYGSQFLYGRPEVTYHVGPSLMGLCAIALLTALADTALALIYTSAPGRRRVVSGACVVAALVVVAGIGIPMLGDWATLLSGHDPPDMFLAFERVTNLESQLSPLLPCVLVAATWFLWSRCHLSRLWLLECTAAGDPLTSGRCGAAFRSVDAEVAAALEHPFARPLAVAAWLWIIPCGFLGASILPSFEGPTFDRWFTTAFFGASLWVVLSLAQALTLWGRVRWFLDRLAMHPIGAAYARLSDDLSQRVKDSMYAYAPTVCDFESMLCAGRRLLRDLSPTVRGELHTVLALPETDLDALATGLERQLEAADAVLAQAVARPNRNGTTGQRQALQRHVDAAATLVARILAPAWDCAPGAMAKPARNWMVAAENFVAMQTVSLIGWLFLHTRNLLAMTSAGLLLLLLAVPAYPFQPQRLLNMFLWVLVLGAVAAVVVAIVQMNRSAVLSHLTKSKPNQVGFFDSTLLSPLLRYGALPLVSLVATQFPGIGDALFSWVEPLLRTMR